MPPYGHPNATMDRRPTSLRLFLIATIVSLLIAPIAYAQEKASEDTSNLKPKNA